MDADTVLLPDTVEKMAKELIDNPKLGAVCARYWAKEGRGLLSAGCSAWSTRGTTTCASCAGWRVNVAERRGRDVPAGRTAGTSPSSAVRPEPWDNESLIEDYALTLDLKSRGWRVGAAREAHVYTEPPDPFRDSVAPAAAVGPGRDGRVPQARLDPPRRAGDIFAYFLFSLSVFCRLLWIFMLALMLIYAVPLGTRSSGSSPSP